MDTGLVKQSSFLTPWEAISGGKSEAGRRMEYLLVIYPYGELFEKLVEEQQQFLSDYGLIMKGRNRPHITVAAFQAGEQMEDTLIRWIHRICRRNERFEITLNNYSGFPPHTIYLRVQDPQPFRQLMQQLRAIDDFIRSSGCPPVNLISRPYLSIAGGLTEQIYNKAMADYSQRSFHESFQVEELVLLKREHSFDACRTVNVFRLPANDLMSRPGQASTRVNAERTEGLSDNPA
ncbi:MAG TPA: 2'-5' RNA ligase family protein [Puia sp.]